MNLPLYKLHEYHDEDIRNVLKENGSMDNKNRIRKWKKENWDLLKQLGHTSLDFNKCECRR